MCNKCNLSVLNGSELFVIFLDNCRLSFLRKSKLFWEDDKELNILRHSCRMHEHRLDVDGTVSLNNIKIAYQVMCEFVQ
jgi:hypothetical protein